MRISQFDYELPEELIAQHPLGRRDASRMLVVNRAEGSWRDGAFSKFPSELRAGDTLVLNNTRVFPARLVGRRETTGGRVELLLVRRREDVGADVWEALARPARRLDAGARLTFGGGARLRAEDLSEHSVAPESFEIGEGAAEEINRTRERGGRVVAVGTTTVRALESVVDERGRVRAGRGETALTITPGHEFRVVGALLTNFHLPRSSLLVLVSAFAGRDIVLAAYRHAVAARYRFYSYGDCMFIV